MGSIIFGGPQNKDIPNNSVNKPHSVNKTRHSVEHNMTSTRKDAPMMTQEITTVFLNKK